MRARDRAPLPLLAIMVVTLAIAGLATLLVPGLPYAIVSVPLDVIVNDTALLVGVGVVWLAMLRFRERGDTASGLIAAAFLVSAGLNLFVITAEASGGDLGVGMSLSAPTQEPLYLHAAARLIMAVTLLLGGLVATGRWTPPRGWWWIPVPFGLAVAAGVAIHFGHAALPPWVGEAGLRQLADGQTNQPLQDVTVLAVATQAVSALAFLGASMLYVTWKPEPPSPFPSFLAAALVLGAASELQFLVFPGSYSSVVGSNDVIRLGFAVVMITGIAADLRSSSRALASAEAEVRRLRDAELAAAALAERTHLAREIHDGLSQHLWLAKLRIGQALELEAPPEVRGRMEEVAELVDTGLAEAQQTISALRDAAVDKPLQSTLRIFAESFQRQRGLTVDLDLDESVTVVPPRIAAELLRVVQEAFSNAGRHADATRIVVQLASSGDRLELVVTDNGIGFDPAEKQAGFGLTSMRERVGGLGGRLEIRSSPSAGTSVRVSVPLDG